MKLEVDKEYWIKARFLKKNEFNENPLYFDINDAIDGLVMLSEDADIREELPEPKKVTIPKEVADWIVSCKEYEYDLNDALDDGINDNPKNVQDWLVFPENQDTFARAWLDGYEIEKEPLYTVEIPDPNRKGNNRIYLGKADNTGKVFINKGTFNPKKNKNLWLTESEIKEDFEWAWQFAVPVEE